MELKELKDILEKINSAKVAVYGDFCIDAYWILEPDGSEVSVETGLKGEAVKKQYYNLGGASNIIANLAALHPKEIRVIGVIGEDIFGREIKRQFEKLEICTDYLTIQEKDFSTVAFGKRILKGKEKARIDFGFLNKRTHRTDDILIEGLEKYIELSDVLIFNQQVPGSILNKRFIKKVNNLFKKYNKKIIILDSRHYSREIRNTYIKININEAKKISSLNLDTEDSAKLDNIRTISEKLYKSFRKPIFITMGSGGIVFFDSEGFYSMPAIELPYKIDPVGAGDTVTSSIALCLAIGRSNRTAVEFANLAASVVVKKLYRTGVASAEEILDSFKKVKFINSFKTARDNHFPKYLKDSNIEILSNIKSPKKIKHVVFDHDGTISTLRQGWEEVMESVMIKSIIGDGNKNSYSDDLYNKVRFAVKDYIDKSTGIQTILQMETLVKMVHKFGFIPKKKILDKFAYKRIYNREILKIVNRRIAELKNGEVNTDNFKIKGITKFLNILKDRDVKLYLVSGTDYDDAINEAKILGYFDLFNGGIYGSLNDLKKFSKKMVIEELIKKNNLHGSELMVVGDGPVEINECKRVNGISIGVASNEIKKSGINPKKRERLIKSGADIIIPDFSQADLLVDILFKN